MSLQARHNATFKPAVALHARVAGTWKDAREAWARDNGIWKIVHGGNYCSFLDTGVNSGNVSNYSFSNQNIGQASADRHIGVFAYALAGNKNLTLTSVSIAGVAATIARQELQVSGVDQNTAFAHAHVPTGTTAGITVQWSGSAFRCVIGVFGWSDIQGVPTVETAFAAGSGGNGTFVSDTLSAAGGAGVAAFATGGDHDPTEVTWQGIQTASDDYREFEGSTFLAASHLPLVGYDQNIDVGFTADAAFGGRFMAATLREAA